MLISLSLYLSAHRLRRAVGKRKRASKINIQNI
nr:MAG TPA: hypothetical protein [Caudoviricetes sp.]DAP04054.1 MAG TPA: hypothetical protein [Caudoviricetes sp.]